MPISRLRRERGLDRKDLMDIEYPSPTFPARPNVAITLPDTFEPLVSASVFLRRCHRIAGRKGPAGCC